MLEPKGNAQALRASTWLESGKLQGKSGTPLNSKLGEVIDRIKEGVFLAAPWCEGVSDVTTRGGGGCREGGCGAPGLCGEGGCSMPRLCAEACRSRPRWGDKGPFESSEGGAEISSSMPAPETTAAETRFCVGAECRRDSAPETRFCDGEDEGSSDPPEVCRDIPEICRGMHPHEFRRVDAQDICRDIPPELRLRLPRRE